MVHKNQITNIKWFQNQVLNWYEREGRHFPWRNNSCSKYQLIIAELLLQRTRAETVAGFYGSFVKKFPSWSALDKSSEADLKKSLKPFGLWRQRASSIKKLSSEMASRNGRFPKSREEIDKLPGVGQYIANAIDMFCNNHPKPLLDVNMARVLERFFGPRKLTDIRYDPYLQKLAQDILPRGKARDFNWAILDFASLICKACRPLCVRCPLESNCKYVSQHDEHLNCRE